MALTVKRVLKEYSAASKRAKRQREREARERAKRFKAQKKREHFANVAEAVSEYNNYVEFIQSFHKYCSKRINWSEIKNSTAPVKPERTVFNQAQIQERINNYKPSLSDKLLGRKTKKDEQLQRDLSSAKLRDDEDYKAAVEKYHHVLSDWTTLQGLSQRVEDGNPDALEEALMKFNPFSELKEVGSKIKFSITKSEFDISIYVNSETVIPKYEIRQLSSGKLSKKDLSKTRYYEMYQDHVCSAVIRISRELFACLPLKKARVNAVANILNTSTGFKEEKVILSVMMNPDTIMMLNMETIDPSDSIKNFVHNLKFSKTKGFNPVDKVALIL